MAEKYLQEDYDMKIVGQNDKKAVNGEEDVRKTLDEMKRIREKGLLLQARQVGDHMASFVAEVYRCQTQDDLQNQKVWLCVFAVTVGCESCVQNATAAREVLNAFHDRFRELCPDAYNHSGYSIAMSFYYLAVRSVGDSRNEIGRTFAMLCADEKNEGLQKLGSEIFDGCLARMEQICQPLNQEVL
jgi:hypothetical protein